MKTTTPPPYKIVFFDIETSPLIGYTWKTYDTNVIKVIQDWHFLSFAYSWAHETTTHVYALPDFPTYENNKLDDKLLTTKLWEILNEADLVVGQNSDKFDIKKANTRFLLHGLPPPKPFQSVDTLKIMRNKFSMTSNKLDYATNFLGIPGKLKHIGFPLWEGCLAGDMKSWATMKKYNKQDVVATKQLYMMLRPWHTNHPNITVKSGQCNACPVCASTNIILRGFRYTNASKVQSFQCKDCGKYSQAGKYERLSGEMLR